MPFNPHNNAYGFTMQNPTLLNWYNAEPKTLQGGELGPAIVTAQLPAKFNGSLENARRYAEGYHFGNQISSKINDFGYQAAPVMAGTFLTPFAISAIGSIPQASAYLSSLSDKAMMHPIIGKVYNTATRPIIDAIASIDGIRNAVSKNGIRKTIALAKEGKTGKAVLSGVGDLLDIAGANDLVNVTGRIASKANRAIHAYDAIMPLSYRDALSQGKTFLRNTMLKTPVDIHHPSWEKTGENLLSITKTSLAGGASNRNIQNKILLEGRKDAWALYNGLPQPNGFYIPNGDGTFRYDLDLIQKMDPSFDFSYTYPYGPKVDTLTGAGGHMWQNDLIPIGEGKYLRKIKDRWDISPFERPGDEVSSRVFNFINEKLRKSDSTTITDILDWIHYNNAGNPRKVFNYIDKKAKSFEAGPLVGGVPFMMQTDIPLREMPSGKLIYDKTIFTK